MPRTAAIIRCVAALVFWSGSTVAWAEPCLPSYNGITGAETLTAAQCRAYENWIMGREILNQCHDLDWNYEVMQAMTARELLNVEDFRKDGPYYEVAVHARNLVSHSLGSVLDTTMGTGYQLCSIGVILFGTTGTREVSLLIEK